ncbi:uncharacterized protein LOC109790792 [Cajanus cajan]|uniref:uncharacterized protein LOC109790792 n=1 Tax=Cajanus cajan TaxID=3821 RepID=UPI00098D9CB9|nr:uncharacterized protein LOC109790792 [Cajanus cajan]
MHSVNAFVVFRKIFELRELLLSFTPGVVLRAGRVFIWRFHLSKSTGRKDVCARRDCEPGAARPTGSQQSRDLAEFQKCNPPQFAGDADPEVADRWIRELEKIFIVLGCPPEKRLAYAVYMLVGEAEHWWRGTYQMLTARGVKVDWECFRTVFMEKYFPESVRHAKEAEFMRLHQGGMTVSEYAMKFEHLALEKAKVVERLESGNRVVRTAGGSSWSKKGESQRKPYDKPQSQQGGSVVRQSSSAASGGRQSGGATLRCFRCAGPHFVRDCPHTESHCFRCHQMGHESASCPTRSRPERSAQRSDVQRAETQRSSAQRADTQRGDRPTTAGRVFALTGAEASTSFDLVKGKGKAAGKDVMILFDSGASHSFISYACAAMMGVPVCDLGLRLLVSTPASASVIASELCVGCPVVVSEKKYKVNLICLPLVDIDIILGMDWLSTNRILIDCANRRLIVPQEEDELLISAGQAESLLRDGAECWSRVCIDAKQETGGICFKAAEDS